jgi:hypothetical protein
LIDEVNSRLNNKGKHKQYNRQIDGEVEECVIVIYHTYIIEELLDAGKHIGHLLEVNGR